MRGMLKGQMVKVKSIEKSKNDTLTAIFTVANRIKVKDQNGKPIPQYFQCYAFGKNAERIRDDFDKKKDDGKIDSRKIDLYGVVQIVEFEGEEEKFLEKSAKAMFKAFGIFSFLDEIEQILNTLKTIMPDDPSIIGALEYVAATRTKGETKSVKMPFKDKNKRTMVKFIVEHIEYVDDGKGTIGDEDRDIMIVDDDTSSSIDHLLKDKPTTGNIDDFINPDKFKNNVPM